MKSWPPVQGNFLGFVRKRVRVGNKKRVGGEGWAGAGAVAGAVAGGEGERDDFDRMIHDH